jgi:hypothetical protein
MVSHQHCKKNVSKNVFCQIELYLFKPTDINCCCLIYVVFAGHKMSMYNQMIYVNGSSALLSVFSKRILLCEGIIFWLLIKLLIIRSIIGIGTILPSIGILFYVPGVVFRRFGTLFVCDVWSTNHLLQYVDSYCYCH